jgi:hypothetical protein
MSRRSLALMSASILLTLAGSSDCLAQGRYRPPGGPTMPRALDYFRQDVGALDPYNTFVAPRRQLDRNLQALNAQEQNDSIRTQSQLSQIRQSGAAATGTGSTFMNYSHYYPSSGMGGGRAVRTRPTR